MTKRISTVKRQTKESNIMLKLGLDGTGSYQIDTGIKTLDHLLSQTAKHGRFDLTIKASGDDEHHVSEDIAICLGKALNEALGEKLGIVRMGDATVPMDDALATVAIDLSGRGYCVLDLPFKRNDMRGFHGRVLYGTNDHHKAEALFKALGRALDIATRVDTRASGKLPSTKQRIER
jgi:imidazoleglycerol-phosphate dehydratase